MSLFWEGDYTFRAYREILEYLKRGFDLHYLIRDVPQILSQIHRPKFLIRHDVTSAPEKVVAMAELENSLSVAASYMFRVNPAGETGLDDYIDTIESVRARGHEVGLHYALDGIPGGGIPSPREAGRMIRILARDLEKAVSSPVFSVSLPAPHPGITDRSLFLGGKVNASSRLMMEWHLSDLHPPWTAEAAAPRPPRPYEALLQVLIHPHLWS